VNEVSHVCGNILEFGIGMSSLFWYIERYFLLAIQIRERKNFGAISNGFFWVSAFFPCFLFSCFSDGCQLQDARILKLSEFPKHH